MTARAIAWSPGAAGPLLEPETPWDWTRLAECQYTDPDAFFPEKGASVTEARRICRGCPVRVQCLRYALGNEETHGIWGGLSERELRALRVSGDTRPAGEILAEADSLYFERRRRVEEWQERRNASEREARAAKAQGLAA